MKTIIILILFSLAFMIMKAEDGKALFRENCASCHKIGEKSVGPDLKNVHSRYAQPELMQWIISSQGVIKNGDPRAVALYEEYNNTVMPDFKFLTPDQVLAIIGFISEESAGKSSPGSTYSANRNTAQNVSARQESGSSSVPGTPVINSDNLLLYLLGGVIGLTMLFAFLVLGNAVQSLSRDLVRKYKASKSMPQLTEPQQ